MLFGFLVFFRFFLKSRHLSPKIRLFLSEYKNFFSIAFFPQNLNLLFKFLPRTHFLLRLGTNISCCWKKVKKSLKILNFSPFYASLKTAIDRKIHVFVYFTRNLVWLSGLFLHPAWYFFTHT